METESPLEETSRPSILWRASLLVLVACGLLLAYHFGALEAFGQPEHLRAVLLGLGATGMLAYLLVVTLLQPAGIPGTMFIVVASLVWPRVIAIPLSLVACTLSTVVGFSFARYVARDWVARRIPSKWRRYDERLEAHGFVTVLLLRLVFWMNPTLHAVLGLSRVRFRSHLAASFVAYVPVVIGLNLLGAGALQLFTTNPFRAS
jgi:uncharacterized membrane protein YdjX (TVP38/TMEM64 family)